MLAAHLDEGMVLCHPFVIGELACGNLTNRAQILSLLAALPAATVATHDEALRLSTEQRLFGRGLGWVDVHLLASALLSRSRLWTKDRALRTATETLHVRYDGAS